MTLHMLFHVATGEQNPTLLNSAEGPRFFGSTELAEADECATATMVVEGGATSEMAAASTLVFAR